MELQSASVAPGGDPDHPDPEFIVHSVPDPFGVFDELTYEIAKLNLTNFTGRTLGRKMGATVQ